MWKYITKEQCNQFLLSLQLIDESMDDKQKIKKLYTISNHIESNYHIFKIKKNNNSFRTIYQPNYILKQIQKNILHHILESRTISNYATAYYKGSSLKKNAIPHINQKIILKLDIKHFFENITFTKVHQAAFPIEYFPLPIGILLTTLCTYQGYLPQGAPTSAYISNLVMKDFDETIGQWCKEHHIVYTRYSDDMTFSGDFNPTSVIQIVKKQLSLLNLKLNYQKIHVIHRNNRQLVTGIVVNEKIQVPNTYRRQIRQEMYYIRTFGLNSHMKRCFPSLSKEEYLASLYGRILYVLQINPKDQEFIKYQKEMKSYIGL